MFIYFRYSDIYKCTKGGHCQITLKTRKNCQFCRFQACEKAGMKRSWVLADGEVKSKKAGNKDVKTRRPFVSSIEKKNGLEEETVPILQLHRALLTAF